MKYFLFKYELSKNLCRECVNREYGLELTRNDCEYWSYPGTCSCCGEVKNIVTGVVFLKRWKIWKLKK
ncbi:MAG: hypothetical protein IKU42_02160 [Oscillospiraceae bacterium]|nr:hypothetical protein [Oscillospiraceae bacterium]